ncbi:MAG TPA: HD domain-containing phosphohydrolase [bacterium]|nr:HD domain-containing phosphohydrolase [bacterium]
MLGQEASSFRGSAVHQFDPPDLSRLFAETREMPAGLDLDSLLTKLARVITSFLKISGLSLKMIGVSEEVLFVKRGDDFKREMVFGSRLLAPEGFAAEALAAGQPLALTDLSQVPAFTLPSYVAREGFKSLVAVPLVSGTREIGMLTIYLEEPSEVSSQVLAIISVVAGVTAAAVENSELVRRIETNYFSTVEALTAAIEAKDPYTRGHSRRVTQFALLLAERFGVSGIEARNLQYGATLHDVGKIGIRGHILNKKGRLTREEYETIKQHPVIGERIIEPVDFLQGARPIVRSHHERFDGTGYPDGLRDEEIPFLARVAGIADFFDALTSDRPYRTAFSVDETNMIIKERIGREFDPLVAKEFLEISSSLVKPHEVPVAIPSSRDL